MPSALIADDEPLLADQLLRKLGAKEIPCPGLCPNAIPEEALPPEDALPAQEVVR